MAAPPLLQLKDIALTFGGTPLLDRRGAVGLDRRARVAGRAQRLGQIDAAEDRGRAGRAGPRLGVRAARRAGALSAAGAGLLRLCRPRSPMSRPGLRPSDDTHAARYLLEQLGLTGQEDPAHLSGGEARRASLARVLAPSPDILLLDEPTNHLDLTTIEWLERDLDARRTALVIISHDRRFLSTLSRSTVWLDRGARAASNAASPISRNGATCCWRRKSASSTSSTARSSPKSTGCATASPARRKRNMRRVGQLQALREAAPHLSRRRRRRHHHRRFGGAVRRAGDRGQGHRQELRRARHRQRLFDPHPARRPHRHRRAERQRQDHADQYADRHACRRIQARCGSARSLPSRRSISIATASIPNVTVTRGADRRRAATP